VNQEESEHNEVDGMKKGVDSTGEVMHRSRQKEEDAQLIFCLLICSNCRKSMVQ